MRSLLGPLLILACPAWLPAQEGATSPKTNARLASVFDASALETSADPCVDFYQYACGTWLAKNPIPTDRPEWARFDELEERNLAILRDILEKASVNNPNRTSIEQKIGDYYAACMDEATIEKEGIEPIQPELDHIASFTDKSDLAAEVARLHLNGVNVLFSFSSEQDFKNSNTMIA